MSIIIFLVMLTLLVFVHELGHFLFAKKNGIRVDEFAIGFPPKLFSFKKGETVYSINIVPLGGFVKIFGENPDEESLEGPDKQRSFVNKSKKVQALVLVAGIIFNILFAFVLFTMSYMVGVTNVSDESGNTAELYVTDIRKDSPAERAGLKKGDIIKSISDEDRLIENVNPDTIKKFVSYSGGEELNLLVSRDSLERNISVVPEKISEDSDYVIGIQMVELNNLKLGFFASIWQGAKMTVLVTKETVVGILGFLKNVVTFSADFKSVSGPVGIAGLVGEASHFGFGYLLSFAALISINLAVINLIPFPALDGGRLLFVVIEAIIRKPINPKIANSVNAVGFILLLILMVFVTVSDVSRLF